jgi:hypothetical protein
MLITKAYRQRVDSTYSVVNLTRPASHFCGTLTVRCGFTISCLCINMKYNGVFCKYVMHWFAGGEYGLSNTTREIINTLYLW